MVYCIIAFTSLRCFVFLFIHRLILFALFVLFSYLRLFLFLIMRSVVYVPLCALFLPDASICQCDA